MNDFFELGKHGLAKECAAQVVDLPVNDIGPHLRVGGCLQQMVREQLLVECRGHFGQKNRVLEYPIFLAEVASTFNEELLTHHLLETTADPKMRAYIINRQIDDLRGTLFRQTMFAEFEKIIHAIEESGDALTLDIFKSEYHKLLETYFAENFVLDPELDLECLRISHFYHAFYVYKYATGISAAVALSQRVLAGATGSVEVYLNFLC